MYTVFSQKEGKLNNITLVSCNFAVDLVYRQSAYNRLILSNVSNAGIFNATAMYT